MTPSHNFFSTNHVLLWTLSFLLLLHSITAQPPSWVPPHANGGTHGFNLKMAVIMVVLVVVFFILGFLSVYTRQCAQTRRQGSVDLALRKGTRGLDPAVIETFPTFIYSTVKGLKLGHDSLECAVCLNEFQDDETLRLIPKCDHVFHPDCIDTWFISDSTCPVCRAYLVPKPGELPYTLIEKLEMYDDSIDEPGQPERVSGSEPHQLPPRQVSIRIVDDQIKEEASPGVNLGPAAPPRSRLTGFRPPRSRSTGMRFTRVLFPRSHSTGHSLVQPGENIGKFTLRLPEEVRSQLMNAALTRARSTSVAFPRAGSTRRGYRTDSGRGKINGYERFDANSRSNQWTFSMMPPFISRTGFVRQHVPDNDEATPSVAAPSGLNRSPSDHIGANDQRSSDALRREGQV